MSHPSGNPSSVDRKSILLSEESSSLESDDYIETVLTLPPDGGWGWIIVTVSFLTNFLVDGSIYTYGMFLQDIAESFNVHATTVSIGTSLLTGTAYAMGPVSSAIVNSLGFQASGFIGGVISAVAFVVCSKATRINLFLLIYGFMGGISFSLIFLPSIIVVGFYFQRWRALATSIAVTGGPIGIIGFPFIMKDLMNEYSWRFKFQVISGLCALTGILALLYRPLKPTRVLMTKDQTIIQVLSDDGANSIRSYLLEEKPAFYNVAYPNNLRGYTRRNSTVVIMPSSEPSIASSFFITSIPEEYETTFTRATASQSEGLTITSENKKNCCRKICCNNGCCSCCYGETTQNRPMYRDDIFYMSSLKTLPEYIQSNTILSKAAQSMQYTMSVTRTPAEPSRKKRTSCSCCPESMSSTLISMTSLQLCKSGSFLCFALSGLLTMLGMYIPYIYIIERADEKKIDPKISLYLYQAIGISNAVGRVLSGAITTISPTKQLIVSSISLTISGISTISSYFIEDIYSHFIYNSVFGLTLACFTSLKSAILVNIVGLKSLTNSFGLSLLINSIGAYGGMPIAAVIKESTGSYNYTFIFAGSVLTLGGILLIPLSKYLTSNRSQAKVSP